MEIVIASRHRQKQPVKWANGTKIVTTSEPESKCSTWNTKRGIQRFLASSAGTYTFHSMSYQQAGIQAHRGIQIT